MLAGHISFPCNPAVVDASDFQCSPEGPVVIFSMTSHRLPLPAAMIPLPTQQASNMLENMPHQWQNSEDGARIQLKIEEDRLKAEEERTKQEQSRVDFKKLELEFLREAHKMGIPPQMIPIMFAGSALKGVAGEWFNEHFAQMLGQLQQHQMAQQQQQHQQHHHQQQQQQPQQQQVHPMPQIHSPGPERKIRRETRTIADSFPQGPPVQPHMGPPPGAGMQPQGAPPASYTSYLPPRNGPAQQPPRPPQINTKDMHPHSQQPPLLPGQIIGTPIGAPHGPMQTVAQGHPPQATQPAQQQEAAIFFHHYVPPNSQASSMTTPVKTSSPQTQLQSPFAHQPPSNQLTGSDYASSPKKRKHGNTPSSQQQTPSTPFSPPSFHQTPLSGATTPSRTRRGHSRHRSETVGSTGRGYEPYNRSATTRHRRSIGGSPLPESGPQLPPVSSAGDGISGGGNGGNGGPHHPREQEHLRQEQQRQDDQQRQEQQRQEQQRQEQQRQEQRGHEQQRQDQQRPQSVPPQPQGRPYSAGPGPGFGVPYPPPHPPPPSSDGGRDSKNGNGRG
ncbi:uncharacterized protein LAJ45_07155 [Morchella importuna]|uniref:uncharacterized protein n=1 Tax=Morchella importuna TaxID=1174673 RepID=UPI001E8E6972|nr:uncharacterized protein LAJ45_07155 [Morchella importuna]KAH8148812.1 hypothetical protein LAJ45_07155 [Morchella importuna]